MTRAPSGYRNTFVEISVLVHYLAHYDACQYFLIGFGCRPLINQKKKKKGRNDESEILCQYTPLTLEFLNISTTHARTGISAPTCQRKSSASRKKDDRHKKNEYRLQLNVSIASQPN